MMIYKDEDGNRIKEGDTIIFWFGIPTIMATVKIKKIKGVLSVFDGNTLATMRLKELLEIYECFKVQDKTKCV